MKMNTTTPPSESGSDEPGDNIWILTVAPFIWVVHFLASYLTNAIWCAKYAGSDRAAGEVRLAIMCYTAIALPGICCVGWRAFRRHRRGAAELPHDFASGGDRSRFLGFSTFLLACLSGVATIFTALVAVFVGSCH